MVLQLSTSPFAARASSSKITSSSMSSSISSTSAVSASPSSPMTRLSFLSGMATGKHRLSSATHRPFRARTPSSSGFTHTSIAAATAPTVKGRATSNTDHITRTVSPTIRSYDNNNNSNNSSMWRRNAFRMLGIFSQVSTLVIVPTLRKSGTTNGFGRGTQFLTIMSMLISIVCLALGTAGDLLKKQRLTRSKNAILPIIVPCTCAVAILYWYLTLTDVYNIYPDGNRYIPVWIDIQMHGLPFVFVFVDMFFYSETFRVKRVADFCAIVTFALFYMGWSSFCAYMDGGEWPYPVLQKLDCPWKRLQLLLNGGAVALVLHVVISETHIRTRTTRKVKHALEDVGVPT